MASILNLIRNWFGSFFGRVIKAPEVIQPEPTPEVAIAKTPGLSCPVCGHRMIVSIENLLCGQDLQCPSCGLELTVDHEKSEAALDALTKLQNGLDQASKIKSQNRI